MSESRPNSFTSPPDTAYTHPDLIPDAFHEHLYETMADHYEIMARQKTELAEANAKADLDPLTGVLNRRSFEGQVGWDATASDSYGRETDRPGSLIFVDIDHFKAVNDTFGHNEGDNVLQAVAQGLQGSVRRGDLVGRYGGEEFVIFLNGTTPQRTGEVIERIRAALLQIPGHAITASMGIAIVGGGVATLEQSTKAADKAMYAVKNGGRNGAAIAMLDGTIQTMNFSDQAGR